MQKSKSFRPQGWPWRKRRTGASAEFARAMARAEFGRHYVSDKELAEVRRSLARAKASRSSSGDKPIQKTGVSMPKKR